jgi:hypothetical protein
MLFGIINKEIYMLDFILQRGKEASTWRGLVALVTAVGIAVSPELGEAIVALGLAVIGVLGVITKDKE